jgi:hypothetical protein
MAGHAQAVSALKYGQDNRYIELSMYFKCLNIKMAERGGFEPPLRFHVNTLSRRAP